LIGTDAFQEVDTYGLTLPITKHNFLVRSAAELLDVVPLAFQLAESGRPGPVAIDVPKDVQNASIESGQLPEPGRRQPLPPCADEPIAALAHLLAHARRPVLYLGGGVIASDASALARMFFAMDTLPIPLIGRVQGAAPGGGAGLAAVCAIVVAEAQAVFGFTEVKLGIVPAVISPFVLAKIGRSAARELFLSGIRFSAERAREIGLAHRVVPSSVLDEHVDSYVREVASAGPEAVAAAKSLIREVWGRTPEHAAMATAQAIAARRVSREGQEGLRAFLEKRKPTWT
jgi:enoyl-CoA hydratase/carnithine racemase